MHRAIVSGCVLRPLKTRPPLARDTPSRDTPTGGGLRVKRECSHISDRVCEPLEGYYCTDPIKDACQGAVEHTKCKPGQFIQQNGTSYSDTVCGDCGNNTYSDGSFTFCKPHTQCPAGTLRKKKICHNKGEVCYRDMSYGYTQEDLLIVGDFVFLQHDMLNTGLFTWCARLRIQEGIGRFLATLIVIAVSLPISHGICMGLSCTPAEYEVKEECCPMCNPGYYVYRHCTEYTSTTCSPCPILTYTDHHNGLESCRKCTVCDTSMCCLFICMFVLNVFLADSTKTTGSGGLRVKRECSHISDRLCEPLEGYYCTDPIKDGCQGAVEHTKCTPGQFIQQNGTSYSDTVCRDCGKNTYSDGSFTFCKPHTQ
ncbi:uncharacterized protein LOC134456449 [Engraulis encrasicolus]|uniref:uncharacterized protein LOC134456449 n=1 Tax=Engraulis encrasicolus TaxID=184585 RepID=UPI002FD2F396